MLDTSEESGSYPTRSLEMPPQPSVVSPALHSGSYYLAKRGLDLAVGAPLFVVMLVVGVVLLVLNPFFNKGPLFYIQSRMGKDCVPFRAYKFRSMVCCDAIARGPFDPVEHLRITRLGRVLRRTRLDELPQVINVLRGQMSLIGPRPDYLEHAMTYIEQVPGYRQRHRVLPGISGYAQTEVGYVDGLEGVHAKVAADLFYLRNASLRFDMWIFWRTVLVVMGRKGR